MELKRVSPYFKNAMIWFLQMKRWFFKKCSVVVFSFKLLPIWNEGIPLAKSKRPREPGWFLSPLVWPIDIAMFVTQNRIQKFHRGPGNIHPVLRVHWTVVALIIKITLWASPFTSWKPHDLGFRNKSCLWATSGRKRICGLGEMFWFLLDRDACLGCWGYKAWDFPWMVPSQPAPYLVRLWPGMNQLHRGDMLNPEGWVKARNARIAP